MIYDAGGIFDESLIITNKQGSSAATLLICAIFLAIVTVLAPYKEVLPFLPVLSSLSFPS